MAYPIKSVTFTQEKARRHQVREIDARNLRYEVKSCNSDEVYIVSLAHRRCECPRDEWITPEHNGDVNFCSHVQAALIYWALKHGYWLVARAETADVARLKRKVLNLKKEGFDHADGVKWTARKIEREKAQAKLERIENAPRRLEDNFLRMIARQSAKRLVGQEAEEAEYVSAEPETA